MMIMFGLGFWEQGTVPTRVKPRELVGVITLEGRRR
jgi:hypothetical protein